MKENIPTAVTALLVSVLVIGICNLAVRNIQSRENAQINQDAQQMADIPDASFPPRSEQPEPDLEPVNDPDPEPAFDDPYARSLLEINLAELQAVNDDVLGWIAIPETPVSYPLLQGEDNSYYLNHTWQGQYNSGGSIFMECQNNSDFSSFNTIIYGHRMSDSSMFNSLRHYGDKTYLDRHPRIYIAGTDGVRVYEVFAVCEVTVVDPVYWLITTQESYKQAVIDFCLEQSAVDTGIIPTVEDRLLTLSTCTGMTASDSRWVVIAVQVGMVGRLSSEN